MSGWWTRRNCLARSRPRKQVELSQAETDLAVADRLSQAAPMEFDVTTGCMMLRAAETIRRLVRSPEGAEHENT